MDQERNQDELTDEYDYADEYEHDAFESQTTPNINQVVQDRTTESGYDLLTY